MVTRRTDWPERLAIFLEAATQRPFEWGRCDCLLFAAEGVQAMTDHDPAAPFRGAYDDAAGAARVLGRTVGGGLAEAIALGLGHEPLPSVLLAQRGDVVLVEVESEDGEILPSVGLLDLDGRQIAVKARGPGVVHVPLYQGLMAWRVG